MGDDRYCFLQAPHDLNLLLEDDCQTGAGSPSSMELPEDDIDVPDHLMPRRQDEDDETILPSTCHPSYPFGNPYTRQQHHHHHGSLSSSVAIMTNGLPPHKLSLTGTGPSRSLATTLPVLSLKHLYSVTRFGESNDQAWHELALDRLLPAHERVSEEATNVMQQQTGDPPQPTGQNAGDHPEDGEDAMDAVDED